jgi:hypothetical protein
MSEEQARRAYTHFWSLPVDKQRDLLWQYALYVEKVVTNEVGDPFLFLKWYLLTEPFEPEEAEDLDA